MDSTRTVGATERTRDAGQTDGRTDGQSETNILLNNFVITTRATTMSAFWEYPHHPLITDTIGSYQNWTKKWHATHLLKFLEKIYKYEMDIAIIVEDT